jgi:L-ascorbate 6-phosphate lactonase
VADRELKRDEFGIAEASDMLLDREITWDTWAKECFPPWGVYLNKQIAETVPAKGKVALWWFGGPSWALKSVNDTFLIDNYAGPSVVTRYENCGPSQTTGASHLHWLRCNPQVMDPWKMEKVDAAFSTHHHADHCDIYTVKALLKTTTALFVGPKVTCQLFRNWGVPEERIKEVKPGDVLKFPDTEVLVEKNFDQMAFRTTTGVDGLGSITPDDVAVTFIFKNTAGNIAFVGDAVYEDGFAGLGARNDIDVTICDMGHNAPGGTDKCSPFDTFRIGQALKTKVLIPDHYENWASSQIDPAQLEWVVSNNDKEMKTVIMQPGGMFTYPDDQDIGRYRYPDWNERYDWRRSKVYGEES